MVFSRQRLGKIQSLPCAPIIFSADTQQPIDAFDSFVGILFDERSLVGGWVWPVG
jgi:hypothetical protein